MRVLFQGAGAIGLAGAALFTDAHDVAVVSRTGGSRPRGSYPRRVSRLDPTDYGQVSGLEPSVDGQVSGLGPAAGASKTVAREWTVNRVASTRRVTITDWRRARQAGPWDLIVLSTRPGELDEAVASAIRETSPRFIAMTSQVEGDLERAKKLFPSSEVVIFGPAFLSERVAAGTVAPGREVRYWAPAGAPRFLIAGCREAVGSLVRELGRLVLPVPLAAELLPPLVFIPFVAELIAQDGDWEQLKTHLHRPARASAEAIHARLGLRVPISERIAKGVLKALEVIVPIDVTEYAGRHFTRQENQIRDMLRGWAAGESDTALLRQLLAGLRPSQPGSAS